jgi:hypothetical protein
VKTQVSTVEVAANAMIDEPRVVDGFGYASRYPRFFV